MLEKPLEGATFGEIWLARHLKTGDRRAVRFCLDPEDLPRLLRQERRRELGAVLDVHRVDIGIGAECEGDGEVVAAVGGAGRLEVERIVDASDLLLNGLRHGRLDDLGVGAGINRGQRHLRRHDLGELRHRDLEDREQAGEGDDDRHHEGKPRPVDEDAGDHGCPPF